MQLTTGQLETDGHVMEGELTCSGCGAHYPIDRGVPRLLRRGASDLDSDSGLGKLQSATEQRFGFEWTYFRDWGWLEEYPGVPDAEEKYFGGLRSHTVKAFWSKTLFKEQDWTGGTTLDGGCGNGRFVHLAAGLGTEIVGVDLGPSTYVAFEHTRAIRNAHIVRGDLFELPFLDGTFDRVFSIGVLQQRGTALALSNLSHEKRVWGASRRVRIRHRGRHLRDPRPGNPRGDHATSDRMGAARGGARRSIRPMAPSGGRLRRYAYARLYEQMNLLPTEHHMFDWYSAPVAHHYDVSDVLGWFEAAGFEVLRTSPVVKDDCDDRGRRRAHASIAALGRKSRDQG